MTEQLDLFNMPPVEKGKAFASEQVTTQEYKPKEGPAEYKAAQEMVHFIAYNRLNDWQQRILWPHLRNIIEQVMPKAQTPEELKFELGYVVGSLEVEQLRSRSAAREIAKKYNIHF
jgi:hypothetical protein